MALDLVTIAGGATAVGTAIGMGFAAMRKAVQAESAITETLPDLQTQLAEHTKDDAMRFERIAKQLTRIESKLDVAGNDISWLKAEAGGPHK